MTKLEYDGDEQRMEQLFAEIARQKDIIKDLSKHHKLSSKDMIIAILVRDNWQIHNILEEAKVRGEFIETQVGGDLYQLMPALDLYKLVIALLNPRDPVNLFNLNNVKVIEFDNITEFSAYVARIYEEAAKDFHADENKNGSVLSYMKEQFYSANNSVNDILKVYFPEQFGERHFLAYPIGHFFVAVTNMWDSENGGIRIENMNDIAECLYSGALYEKKVGLLINTFNQTRNYFSRATKLKGDSETDGVIDLLKKLKKQISKLNNGKIEYNEQLAKLSYFNVELDEIDELIEALEALNTITKIFYEDFENENNNFKHFYEKLKDFVETQILPTADAESEFQDILLRLLVRLEEVEKIETTSTFDCLKDTMAYYLKQESQKGESANWIVRDFQQIDGDILKSSIQDSDIIYHFACVSDSDMNVKREDQFPWPLTIEFFESAYEPLDWKYQVYVKSRKEFKHFKRYALIYGLEFNRCKFKLSFIKNDDDKENELYYILKLLGVKTEKNIHDTKEVHEKQNITFDLGKNTNNFVDLDGFRRRICGYRFPVQRNIIMIHMMMVMMMSIWMETMMMTDTTAMMIMLPV